MLSPNLETYRLILRKFEEKDLDAFYEILHDDRLHKYVPFPNLTKEEELEYIRKCISNADIDKCEKWAIVLKDNN